GVLGQTYGDATVDIIQNSALLAKDQWKTFQPMTGGILDGVHIIGNNYDGTWTSPPGIFNTIPNSIPNVDPGSYLYALHDPNHEFVTIQGKLNSFWGGLTADVYGTNTNYLTPTDNGNADTICVWAPTSGGATRCMYGAIVGKMNRSNLILTIPAGSQNGHIGTLPYLPATGT